MHLNYVQTELIEPCERTLTVKVLRMSNCSFPNGLQFLRCFPGLEELGIVRAKNLETLSGIENCPNLRSLQITRSSLNDLSGIEYCSLLNTILIYDSCLEDVSLIAELPIVKLAVENSMLKNVPNGMKFLSGFSCQNNPKVNLSGLKDAPLEYLKCGNCGIRNLDFLEGKAIVKLLCDHNKLIRLPSLPILKRLECSYNRLEDLSTIASTRGSLVTLIATDCRLKSLYGLQAHHDLSFIHVCRNSITSLRPLENLKNLETLRASSNRVRRIPEFQANRCLNVYLEDNPIENPDVVSALTIKRAKKKGYLYQFSL